MIPIFASSSTHQPTASSSALVATEPPFAPASAEKGIRTVLVVDDDSAIRNLAALVLESLGYQTLTAGNGLEALKLLETNRQVDTVLLDLLMPVMNGEETFRALRKEWPSIAVVMISGFDAVTINERLGTPGADGFVQKPFTLNKLNDALAAAWK